MSSKRCNAVLSIVLTALATATGAEEQERSERERMYDRYLEFPSLIEGGSITPCCSALEELHFRSPEPFVAKAADGETDLHGVLYKPWDFDPARKYPVIEHIYNSPYRSYVPRAFSGGAYRGTYAQALAQLGFVTFMVDGRGTPGRGKAFYDVIYGELGRLEP